MKDVKKKQGPLLLVIGLMGIVSYSILQRSTQLPIFENDLFHGLWLGVFLGIELLGALQIRKDKIKAKLDRKA